MATILDNPTATILCQPYSCIPYDCHQMTPGSVLALTNQNTLVGFYLGPQNQQNAIQSLYQRGGNPLRNLLPVAVSNFNDLFYTQVVECTIEHLQSNYIKATIGPILGLNNEQMPVDVSLYALFLFQYSNRYIHFITAPVSSRKTFIFSECIETRER